MRKQKGNVLIVILILLLLAISFVVVYLFGQNQELGRRNLSVSNQSAQPTSVLAENRILLTQENESQYNTGKTSDERCIKFNTDPANKFVNYINEEKGISIEIPFNEKWGNDKYRINPYEVDTNKYLVFSFISPFEACQWVRLSHLAFLPQISLSESVKEVEADGGELCKATVQELTVNGVSVIKYEPRCGMTSPVYYRIIGKKFNYELYAAFGGKEQETEFEYMIKTIKFI